MCYWHSSLLFIIFLILWVIGRIKIRHSLRIALADIIFEITLQIKNLWGSDPPNLKRIQYYTFIWWDEHKYSFAVMLINHFSKRRCFIKVNQCFLHLMRSGTRLRALFIQIITNKLFKWNPMGIRSSLYLTLWSLFYYLLELMRVNVGFIAHLYIILALKILIFSQDII